MQEGVDEMSIQSRGYRIKFLNSELYYAHGPLVPKPAAFASNLFHVIQLRLFAKPSTHSPAAFTFTMENQAVFKMVLCGDGGTVSMLSSPFTAVEISAR